MGSEQDIEKGSTETLELETLMLRYQQADSSAAAVLIGRVSPQIFQFLLARARDRSRAEDLLQDFWLRIHRARHTYRPGEPVLPWLYAIARRTQIDDFRKRSRVARYEQQADVLPERGAAAEDLPGVRSQGPDLAELVAPLPETQREVILMLKAGGLSLEEVARATGSSVGAVKQKAHRAYETLRKVFGEQT